MNEEHTFSFWKACKDKKISGIFLMGISAGISLGLVLTVMNVWLAKLGIDKSLIGSFSLLQIPYIIRFLWAPCLDHMKIPFFHNRFGKRRSWAIAIQIFLFIATERLGASDPESNMSYMVLWAFVLSFGVATQDILLDLTRIEILTKRNQGIGTSSLVTGFRVGGVITGGLLLILIDYLDNIFCPLEGNCSWYWGFCLAAVLAAIFSVIGMLFIDKDVEDEGDSQKISDIDSKDGLSIIEVIKFRLKEAIVEPFVVFMKKKNWHIVIIFILLYKFCDAFIYSMINPFFIDKGFSLTDIGLVLKTFGLFATLFGSIVGSFISYKFGIMNALIFSGICQTVANLTYVWQDYVGHNLMVFYLTVGLEWFSGSMALAAFLAYLSSICDKKYAATQYALLSSIAMLVRVLISPIAGYSVDLMGGWTPFFLFSFFSGIPVIVIMFIYRKDLENAMNDDI